MLPATQSFSISDFINAFPGYVLLMLARVVFIVKLSVFDFEYKERPGYYDLGIITYKIKNDWRCSLVRVMKEGGKSGKSSIPFVGIFKH